MRPDQSPRDETLLVRRAQAGDVTAFEALYRAHVGRIHALCLRMTSDRATAEDLTQEAFIRAWQRLDSFRGDSAFYSWLYRLTVNVVLGDFRVKKRLAERVSNSEDVSDLPLAAAERPAGLRMDLDQAIAALPPGAREIFVLHDVEGYKHEEIAEMTGLATGTSKAHLHRARRLLREQLL
ncbi:MAG: sigma-70 family RNA polymerase sigma factor [Candidatus Hydrogenedentes bacterium]|nr:sigma-70 family RNA polymerase sigma factor [Candidatus Hydrogenedentota bacterium]